MRCLKVSVIVGEHACTVSKARLAVGPRAGQAPTRRAGPSARGSMCSPTDPELRCSPTRPEGGCAPRLLVLLPGALSWVLVPHTPVGPTEETAGGVWSQHGEGRVGGRPHHGQQPHYAGEGAAVVRVLTHVPGAVCSGACAVPARAHADPGASLNSQMADITGPGWRAQGTGTGSHAGVTIPVGLLCRL